MDNQRENKEELNTCPGCRWCESREVPQFEDDDEELDFWERHTPEQFGISSVRLTLRDSARTRLSVPTPPKDESAFLDLMALSLWSDDYEDKDSLKASLRDEGLDPEGLIKRVTSLVDQQRKNSWRDNAESLRESFQAQKKDLDERYRAMTRQQLADHPALKVANFRDLSVDQLTVEQMRQIVSEYEADGEEA